MDIEETVNMVSIWGHLEAEIEVQSSVSHITQAIDDHAIGIGKPLGNNCAGPVFVSTCLWQEDPCHTQSLLRVMRPVSANATILIFFVLPGSDT